jgi:hypothetical protein
VDRSQSWQCFGRYCGKIRNSIVRFPTFTLVVADRETKEADSLTARARMLNGGTFAAAPGAASALP